MATNTLDTEIRSRITTFVEELSLLVKRQALEAVHAALGEAAGVRPTSSSASAAVGRGRPKAVAKTSTQGKRVRRSSADLTKLQAGVLAQVRSKQGQRIEDIGRAMKTDTAELKRPVALLLAEKKLKTKGQKRGTMYFTK